MLGSNGGSLSRLVGKRPWAPTPAPEPRRTRWVRRPAESSHLRASAPDDVDPVPARDRGLVVAGGGQPVLDQLHHRAVGEDADVAGFPVGGDIPQQAPHGLAGPRLRKLGHDEDLLGFNPCVLGTVSGLDRSFRGEPHRLCLFSHGSHNAGCHEDSDLPASCSASRPRRTGSGTGRLGRRASAGRRGSDQQSTAKCS